MTTYQIAFINMHDISHCFKINNLSEMRYWLRSENLKNLVVAKIVNETIVYFNIYRGGKREQKLIVNMPVMK